MKCPNCGYEDGSEPSVKIWRRMSGKLWCQNCGKEFNDKKVEA